MLYQLVRESRCCTRIQKKQIPENLLNPSRVILGGGGSNKTNLVKTIIKNLTPNGIIVIPIATIENLEKLSLVIKNESCNLKISQHLNFRGIPLINGTRLHPMNPVFIIKGQLK